MKNFNNDIKKSKNYFGHALDLSKTDKRLEKFHNQRKELGFDSSELWNLDMTTLRFFYPRFIAFKNNLIGHPGKFKSIKIWEKILNKIQVSLEWYLDDNNNFSKTSPKHVDIGIKFLIKYYHNLWN
jgi:hypothetical protein